MAQPFPLSSNKPDIVPRPQTAKNLLKYLLTRVGVLAATAVCAVYLTIIVANLGGYVDEIVQSRIDLAIADSVAAGWLKDVPLEERTIIIEQTNQAMQEAQGLNQPFLLRTMRWLWDGLTLDWGEPNRPRNYNTSTSHIEVRTLIKDHLARTLIVFGTTNLLVFVITVTLALMLTRRYGSWLDRLFITLSPLSAAPAWVYGVLLSVALLRLFSFSTGGTFDTWPATFNTAYIPILLRHLFPVVAAMLISSLFQGVYAWRTFFLIYSSEEYVDLAKAKGLPTSMVERRYILRPALPGLITSFALLTMTLWQEIIALEYFFNVAGIGRLLITALNGFDIPVIVGLVVTFAYLLTATVFILDIIYAFVDPRIRMGNDNTGQSVPNQRIRPEPFWRRTKATRRPAQPLRVSWSITQLWRSLKHLLRGLGTILRELLGYPTAVIGLLLIITLSGIALYAITTTSATEVITLWRGDGGIWNKNPREALPSWVNYFRLNKLPQNITFDSHQQNKEVTALTEEMTEINFAFTFDYPYTGFPQDIVINFEAQYEEKLPFLVMTWITPDGREIEIYNAAVNSSDTYHLVQDERLERKLGGIQPQKALFMPEGGGETAVPGTYTLQFSTLTFEDNADIEAQFTLFGQVYGLAGTDANRRDITVALLWGTPIALAFGLIAAVTTSITSMALAAIAAWYGGWADRIIQFFTEVNLILPFFPVSLMIFILYSKSIWTILAVTVILSIFGNSIKTYRATFLQFKQAPYIEAAQAYGTSDRRIITRYLVPRIISILVPKLVILVPSYVFLEATLAFLGVSDPALPTWGKLVANALEYGVYRQAYHLVLIPLGLLLLTGFAFALVGMALEKVFEPRLRKM